MAAATPPAAPLPGSRSLEEHDPEMFALLQEERARQQCGLELIASENFTSKAVMQCLGSALTNKYSEGYPGKRYYGGNTTIDKIERLCQTRALGAFRCDPEKWGVNVQPYSGSPANFAVYTALLNPHDRIMGLDLPSGGHLTHGFYTLAKDKTRKPVSATSVYFESLPYKVDDETGLIDYAALRQLAGVFKPKLLICGGSAYAREWDYPTLREIADENGSLLMMDMAHISGLIATGEAESPFEYCDIVTTTTHKSLRGPRSGMIFFRKDERDFETRINNAVFPALQGGPHEHQIAGVATQLKEVVTPEFKAYCVQVKANAKALAATLMGHGYKLVTGGTDNHLILWDLRPLGLTGSKVEKLCDTSHITLNKNAVHGDKSALAPGGVRIGTCALTTRGLNESDFAKVGDLLHQAVQLCSEIQLTAGKMLKDFLPAMEASPKVAALREEVHAFAGAFPMPGL
jgi:glycine hydroxymethyltransferase